MGEGVHHSLHMLFESCCENFLCVRLWAVRCCVSGAAGGQGGGPLQMFSFGTVGALTAGSLWMASYHSQSLRSCGMPVDGWWEERRGGLGGGHFDTECASRGSVWYAFAYALLCFFFFVRRQLEKQAAAVSVLEPPSHHSWVPVWLCSRPHRGLTSERVQNVSAANLAFQPFDAGSVYCFIP